MSKKPVTPSKGVNSSIPAPSHGKGHSKSPEKKPFNIEDYVTMTTPLEQVKDIKQAFDIFDTEKKGIINPLTLKEAFIKLGFGGDNKFVYQILAELDDQ